MKNFAPYLQRIALNCLLKLAQEIVWLGELTVAVDLGRKATKQTIKQTNLRALSDKNCLSLGLLSPLITFHTSLECLQS